MWPRGLPRANMSRKHEKHRFRSLTSHTFAWATCRPRVDIDTRSADSSLMSHTFARASCRPEPERCRFLVDVAQKSSNKFCRNGGRGWQVVASGGMVASGVGGGGVPLACLCFAECRSFQNLSKWFHHALLPFGGGGLTIPSGITAAPSKFGLSVCGKAILGLEWAIPGVSGAILGSILGVWKAMFGGDMLHRGPWKGHVADLASHFVAKRAANSQQEH